jgi:hypothetical protein
MCTVLLPPGVNPIAVDKYIISYQLQNYQLNFDNTWYYGDTKILTAKLIIASNPMWESLNLRLYSDQVYEMEDRRSGFLFLPNSFSLHSSQTCCPTHFIFSEGNVWGSVNLTFWHRSFIFKSNKSPTWCNSFSVYYPKFFLQLNMFRAFTRSSSGAQRLQWQHLVFYSYRGDSRAVFVIGPAGRPDHEHSTTVTTIRR